MNIQRCFFQTHDVGVKERTVMHLIKMSYHSFVNNRVKQIFLACCLLLIFSQSVSANLEISIQLLNFLSGNSSSFMPCDFTNDQQIDLKDAISYLKMISGMNDYSETNDQADGIWTLTITKTMDSKGDGIGFTETGIIRLNQMEKSIQLVDKNGNIYEGARYNNCIYFSGHFDQQTRYDYCLNLLEPNYLIGKKRIQSELETSFWKSEYDIVGIKAEENPCVNVSGIWDVKSYHDSGTRIGVSEIFMTPKGQIIGEANLTTLAGESMVSGQLNGYSFILDLKAIDSNDSMHATGKINSLGDHISGVFYLHDKDIEIKWSGERRDIKDTFDATGIWNFNISQTYNGKLDPFLTQEEAIVEISQSGHNYTFVDKNGDVFQGTVYHNYYIFDKSYTNGKERTCGFYLDSSTSAIGIQTILWIEDTYSWKDQYAIMGSKANTTPSFDITGKWDVTRLLGTEIIAGFVNVTMTPDGSVTGNAFLPGTIDGESLIFGKICGHYFVFRVNSIDSPNTLYATGRVHSNGTEISGKYFLNDHIFEVSWSGIKQTQ